MFGRQRGRKLAIGIGLAVIIGGVFGRQAEAATPDVEKYLQSGKLAEGESVFTKHLAANPKDDNARYALGTVQLLRGVERLMQALHKYGLRERGNVMPFLRLPAPNNAEPEEIRYEQMRKIFETLHSDLAKSEKTLAGISSKDVKMKLHFALIRMDFNGDGNAEERETLWKIYARLTNQRTLGAAEAEKFVIAFDHGDVHWLRGYCHLLMAMNDFILAHDWKDSFERTAQLFFKSPDTAFRFLEPSVKERGFFGDPAEIADVIAFIHLLRYECTSPKRMKDALGHLDAMVQQSRLMWKSIEAETDDEAEWIPNAKQTSVLAGARITGEMIAEWKAFLDEFELILQGKKLVPHWRIKSDYGINIRRVFTEPTKFDLVLWVQGTAAKPYLERGPMTKPEFWRRMQNTFRGNFVGFAIWLN